ncbi:MAG TPA: glycoside hydrolase family 15 protein [Amnibacterium sp.]|jgi:GH15 family glucan-1,4-alpha-glucosidase|uniref:glycoside hydrolase family 15 protein n=1 Tax=Amnibacterium sp. TaxID=1872496 RepID=UPI002F9371B7
MPSRIEDYAFVSDCYTGALIGIDGSVDWLCFPRYDSESMFASLLGNEDNGRWLLAPQAVGATATRHYGEHDLTLVTRWDTGEAEIEVLEFMPRTDGEPNLIRRVRGIRGRAVMREELQIRFEYGEAVPWVTRDRAAHPAALVATAGPDSVVVRGPELHAVDTKHVAEFEIGEGETVDLSLTWFASHKPVPPAPDIDKALRSTRRWWSDWSKRNTYEGPYGEEVHRSLLVLRALTHAVTGGIVAAATTSLPEQFGGPRNWDYRYVWLRDASLTISVLVRHGYRDVVDHWRQWLLRAIAGDPEDLQIMYGIAGERRLNEYVLPGLPGYEGSTPVRVGNAASLQYQADVIGEVMVALQEARSAGIKETALSWSLQRALMAFLEDHLGTKDQGLWEARGEPHFYTQGRAMIWAALDSAVRGVRDHGLEGPADRWERLRDEVRADIERHGFDERRNTYTQYFGSEEVDASLLLLPQVGYCAPDDPRMLGTVAAIEHDLMQDGLPLRYRTAESGDGLPAGENPFLACGFWLAEQYARSGRLDDARAMMDRLCGAASDLGLLSEEYDTDHRRQAGNTPQALSHLALIRTADAIGQAERAGGATTQRLPTGGR